MPPIDPLLLTLALATLISGSGCGELLSERQEKTPEHIEAQQPDTIPLISSDELPNAPASVTASDDLAMLLARGCAVVKVLVTGHEEIDNRPACGSLDRRYNFEVLASSGEPIESVSMMLASGGMRPVRQTPANTSAERRAELDSYFLQTGETYWLLVGNLDAIHSVADTQAWPDMLPYPLLGWWSDGQVPEQVREALLNDHYNWHPFYHGSSGLAFGYEIVTEQQWKIIVKDGYETRWEAQIDGMPVTEYPYGSHVYRIADGRYGLRPIEPPLDSGTEDILYTDTLTKLDNNNRFEVQPGEYRVLQARLLNDGGLIAEIVYTAQRNTYIATRQVRPGSGDLQFTERIDYLSTGGRALGYDSDHWIRKTERYFDPNGALSETHLFRYQKTFDEQGRLVSHGYVPMDSD